jgi:hypothetical protein
VFSQSLKEWPGWVEDREEKSGEHEAMNNHCLTRDHTDLSIPTRVIPGSSGGRFFGLVTVRLPTVLSAGARPVPANDSQSEGEF